jgi:thioredoxin 1
MAVDTLTMDNINQTIENNDIVFIDFWAPWCAPCRAFKPILESFAEKHPEVKAVACNTEEEQELAAMFQIRSIPTLMVFREQILVFAQPGLLPEEALEELLGKVKELDMDEVRKEIEAQEAQRANA